MGFTGGGGIDSRMRLLKLASDFGVLNSVVLEDVPDMVFRVEANRTYCIQGTGGGIVSSGTGADCRYNLSIPAAATHGISHQGSNAVFNSADVILNLVITIPRSVHFFSVVRTAGTAGNVQLQWAQSVAVGGVTSTIRQGYSMRVFDMGENV